ncbi:glycerophosphodiester phosphodiesterase [Auraticoccus monumenti]|uniref:Glycerophosphoryl diester phosphodiesterase n=1 Tax=Auraticoccus monumenti TaxID=675864 RepID=A0A1G6SHH8_9ACTN|nr:glycerophosphodiester phosphodiesterase family protein [Auraticoccus monumenti]SDD16400.1 glycerophosphoryl diester phosphodiesterase [Auraticoccus monumenti]
MTGQAAIEVVAHRGSSAVHPESTRAAYRAAVELARRTGHRVELEGDVHFSADDQLVVLHDLTLRRTGGRPDAVAELTVAELKQVDVGSWKVPDPTPEQRELITFAELLDLVAGARDEGVDVGLAVETKHPTARGLDVDRRALEQLADRGWTRPGAPVRMISFEPRAVALAGKLAPALRRSLLVEKDLGPWADGHLPEGVDTVGVDHRLAERHPGWVDRLLARGHRLHLWTVNDTEAMRRWLDRGATGLTTDHPDRALAVVHGDPVPS